MTEYIIQLKVVFFLVLCSSSSVSKLESQKEERLTWIEIYCIAQLQRNTDGWSLTIPTKLKNKVSQKNKIISPIWNYILK